MTVVPQFFCPKLWQEMSGDEAERFCAKCQKQVYNLQTLSLDQRVELLRAGRGEICGRYQIAVRRAVRGKEQSYMQHLLKYGAGVAASSAVFITLWQLYAEQPSPSERTTFRVAPTSSAHGMFPPPIYEEFSSIVTGMIIDEDPEKPTPVTPIQDAPTIEHVDITLDPAEVAKLIPPSPVLELTPAVITQMPHVAHKLHRR